MQQPVITKIKVTKHETIAAAVIAVGMDLSYNPGEASRYIKWIQKDTTAAYSTEEGKVLFVYKCPDGVMVLNEFQPFCGVISDSPFSLARIDDGILTIGTPGVPKNKAGRKVLALLAEHGVMGYSN